MAGGSTATVKHLATKWDPLDSSDWDKEKSTTVCTTRIQSDLAKILQNPLPGICVVPNEDDITKLDILIIGPFDTPYEGGFFHFLLRFPPNYPYQSPRVRMLTTGGGAVRFNPNLYQNGKVCLSILGTWYGPIWTPAQTLQGVLLSIQSIMSEKPYHNEPGYEQTFDRSLDMLELNLTSEVKRFFCKSDLILSSSSRATGSLEERSPGDVQAYNNIIIHETVRVAVCNNLDGQHKFPSKLLEVMKTSFLGFYESYVGTCKVNMKLQGHAMRDPFGQNRGTFDFEKLLSRITAIHSKLKS